MGRKQLRDGLVQTRAGHHRKTARTERGDRATENCVITGGFCLGDARSIAIGRGPVSRGSVPGRLNDRLFPVRTVGSGAVVVEHIFLNGLSGDTQGEGGNPEDPDFGIRRPLESSLTVFFDPGDVVRANVGRADEQDVRGTEAAQVLRLRSHVRTLDPVPPVAGQDQKARLDLLDPLKDALEGFADEDLCLYFDIGKFLCHHLRSLEIGLRQLQETLVDDVVVELLLLLELEDLRGLHGEYVFDVPEHRVVVLHVEGRAHMQLRPKFLGHLQGMPHGLIRV